MKDYGMYSVKGNQLVDRVVAEAQVQSWSWQKTYRHLQLLAKAHPQLAAEAMDTVVRENVYKEIKGAEHGEPFYF